MTEMIELTDEEDSAVDAAMADPSLIHTIARAEEILEFLSNDIGDITAQLEASKMEAEICGSLTEARVEWVRRATTALVWKKRQQKKIEARIKELTPPPDPVTVEIVQKVKARVANDARDTVRIKEQELLLQRQREKDAAKLERVKLTNKRNLEQAEMFMKIAHQLLPPETTAEIWRRAREAYPDSLAWR
jgi:hypothetical protein